MIAYPFAVGGVRTRVLEAGAGGRAAIFVHGLSARADRWRLTLEAFAGAGYHAYAIDLPGHGFADKGPDFPYGVPGYARFVQGFMEAMALGRAAVIGTSLGGHIAAQLACERPESVSALVLVGSLGLVPLGREQRRAIGANVLDTTREGTERKLRYVVHDPRLVTAEWVEEEYRINNSPGAREAFARLRDYLVEEPGIDDDIVAERLAPLVVRIPVLLVWGQDDIVVPVTVGERALGVVKGAKLVTIGGANHQPYFERPDEFNRLVLPFLAGGGG